MRLFVPALAGVLCLASGLQPFLRASAPDAERLYPELKVFDPAGHPWRAAREDWEGARKRVASDPEWAAWLRRERRGVDAWIAHHEDHVAWAAGWSHDGVSPKDGSAVTWVDRIPGVETDHFFSPSDPDIAPTPKLVAWWVVTFRDQQTEMMVRAARLYRLTGDDAYATWVIRQMSFYADNLLRFQTLPTARTRLFWQTLTEASNLTRFVEAVRLLGGRAAPALRERWRAEFFSPEVAVLNATHHDIHNIATWQRSAAAEVALLYGDQALWRQAIDGKWGLGEQLRRGITADGLWFEQSLGYNNFVVTAVGTLFTAAGLDGRAAELAPEMTAAENLMLAPVYLRFPNGQLPNPADNHGLSRAPDRHLFAASYRFFPTTLGLADAAGERNWDTLLDPPPPSPRPPALPPVTSRNLEATREAILKSGPWQVYFHYGQLTRSHSQAEALNFEAFYRDTDVTHDPGTVGYGSPLHRNYYTQGLNHNVPLIGGEGEIPPQPGVLLAFSPGSGGRPAEVSAAQPRYRPGGRATRTLRIEGAALIDALKVETDRPEPLGFAFHVEGRPVLPPGFRPDPAFASGRPVAFAYWRDVTAADFPGRAEFDVRYGATVLHVTLTAPGRFRLWHGSAPDVPPRRRDSFYLELAQPAAQAEFGTRIAP